MGKPLKWEFALEWMSILSIPLSQASHNIEDNQGRTPLHWAAASTSEDNVKVRLSHVVFIFLTG